MTTTLKGGKELMAFLDALPERLRKNAVRASLTAAAAVIRDQARANAPRETGKMAKAIKSGRPNVNQDGTVSVKVRMRGEHSFLGTFIEYGTSPHFISAGDSGKSPRLLTRSAKNGGMNTDGGALKIGNNYVTGAVWHPGIPAKPFLRPALDQKANEAINAFGAKMRTYLKDRTGFTAPYVEVDEE